VTLIGNLKNMEVAMIMVAAPGIEPCPASRAAGITLHVLKNSYRCTASTAKYGSLIPFVFRPHRDRVTGERHVAVFASIVKTAAFHLDGNNVGRPVVMLATGL
jgi:hypothetical protein